MNSIESQLVQEKYSREKEKNSQNWDNLSCFRAAKPVDDSELISFVVPIEQELSQKIAALCDNDAQLEFTFWLSAFTWLTHQYSGHQQIFTRAGLPDLTERLLLQQRIDRKHTFKAHFNTLKTEISQSTGITQPNKTIEKDALHAGFLHHSHSQSPFQNHLTLILHNNSATAGIEVSYTKSLFTGALLKHFVDNLVFLTRQIAANPQGLMEHYPFIGSIEMALLTKGFVSTEETYEAPESLWAGIMQQQDHFADRVAVRDTNTQWTYAQLTDKALRMAACIQQKHQISQGHTVAIFMEQSPAIIPAVLAVMAAGATFVPIDTKLPVQRVSDMLNEAKPDLLISESFFMADLMGFYTGKLLISDLEETEIEHHDPCAPCNAGPQDDCYVLFTSGSTGKPKGVLNSHGSLANYAAWANYFYFDNTQGHSFAFFTSLSFDLTFTSLFSTLLRGDTIQVISQTAPDKMIAQIFDCQSQVNTVKLTPSHIELLKEVHQGSTPVQKVIVGGEALLPGQVQYLQSVNPEIHIYNEYGPTETTVGCTVLRVTDPEQITIGRPMAQNRLYVIDQSGEPLPIGMTGELVVAGPGLAKAYLNDPQLTANKFRQPKSKHIPEDTLYHTGDLARWLPDGQLAFLGRMDRQVKVRGHRVELADVEQAMLRLMPLEQAIVVLHKKQLVAYYTAKNDQAPNPNMLLPHLPDYMVPNSFIKLEKVPLTNNGKTDYNKLPDPDKANQSKEITEPKNQTEKILLNIWKEVLGKNQISTHHNFFALGGDSIKAISLISKTNQALKLTLEVKDVFNHQSISAFAEMLTSHQAATPELHEKAGLKVKEFKTERLEKLKQKGLVVNELEDIYPLSDIELGMIFYNQLQKKMATYHDQFFYLFEDRHFDLKKLTQTLAWMSRKHDILRAQYILKNDETPYKLIWNEVDVSQKIQCHDLNGKTPEEQQEFVKKAMQTDREQGFEEEVGLWRILVFEMGQDQYGFLLSFHHAIIDGWSRALFVTELNKVYEALQNGSSPSDIRLQSSYKDYVIDQLRTSEDEQINAYWQKELKDFQLTNLPFRTGAYKTKKVTHRVAFDIDTPLKKKLLNYTTTSGISLKHFCFGVFLQLIKLTTATRDVTVGLVTNGRPALPDAEQIIGCFLNTIPFRDDTAIEHIAANEYIGQINDKLTALKSYDKLSLVKIRQMTGIEGNQNIFDILFSYVDFFIYQAVDNINMMDSDIEYFESTNTNFDFGFGNSNGYMGYSIAYNPEIYSNKEIEYFGECYIDLIRHLLDEPEIPVSSSLFQKNDKLKSFQESHETYEAPESLWAGIMQQQDHFADRVAVRDTNTQWTYAQLTDKALRMAACIQQKHQISQGHTVAIFMEQSPAIIPAVLAVMAAGATFVPIDTKLPVQRVSDMLNEAKPDLLISESFFMADLMGFYTGKLLISDLEETEIEHHDPCAPCNAGPQDDCYVLFTSGSTGKPKGVLNSHGSLANYAAWANYFYFDNTQGHSFAFFTSLSFDLTFTSLFSTLLRGDTIQVISQTAPDKMIAQIFDCQSQVNTVKLTPSHIELLKEVHQGSTPVQKVIVGGEALLPGQVQYLQSVNPEIHIYNEYGPTETTVGCTVLRVTDPEQITIGRPMAQNRLYVIDQSGEPLPIGMTGELVVAGPGLAKAYLNDPQLTANKFRQPKSKHIPEDTLYHTGDLARWLPDGQLAFLGRMDRQVKVRGHRVELADVEQAMLRLMPLEQAIVVLHKKQLVAYYTAKNDQAPNPNMLLPHLPDYMVPNSFIKLEKVPLTNNGKTDYNKLPDPDKANQSKEITEPKNQTEKILLNIWKEVLGKNQISTHHNFFALGGDSIMAIQVCARVQNHGYKLEVNDLFEGLEIRQVALAMQKLDKISEQGLITGVIPLSPIQKRFLQHYKEEPDRFHQSFVLSLKQARTTEVLNAIFHKLIQHHDALRIKVEKDTDSGEWKQVNSDQFEVFSLTELGTYKSTNDEELIHAVQELYQDIRLDTPPLIRVATTQIESQQHLIIVIHHMAIDGVSWRILLEDLEQLLQDPISPELPLKTDSFRQWVESLVEYTQATGFTEKLKFWQQHAKEADYRIVPEQNADSADVIEDEHVISIDVGSKLTETLNSEETHSKLNTEITDFLYTSLGLTYQQFFGENELYMALESHGRDPFREDLNINRTVGWFTNIYPASFSLESSDDLQALIKSFKDETRRLKSHAIDYGAARYLLEDECVLKGNDPNVCFNYMGQFTKRAGTQFQVVTMGLGELMNRRELREYQFVFSGVIVNNSLNIHLSYNQKHFGTRRMESFLSRYHSNLELLVNAVSTLTEKELTVTDLTYAGLTNEDLDDINALL